MKAQQTFFILFWIGKNRIKNGKASISIRITINGKRSEISDHRDVSPLEWNPKSQMVFGKSKEAKDIINNWMKEQPHFYLSTNCWSVF